MTKKKNNRYSKKRAIKWVSDITKDSMRSARRRYGQGASR